MGCPDAEQCFLIRNFILEDEYIIVFSCQYSSELCTVLAAVFTVMTQIDQFKQNQTQTKLKLPNVFSYDVLIVVLKAGIHEKCIA